MAKKRILVLVIVIMCFLMGFSYWYYSSEIKPYNEFKFNSEEWIKDEKRNKWYSYRIGMINDLKKNYLKKGMSVESVLTLLGSPLEISNDSLTFKYSIGARMNMVDPDFLIIVFDKNKKLSEVKIQQG